MAKNKKEDASENVLVPLVLRIAVAVPLFYAATASLLNPGSWIAFIPDFTAKIIPPAIFLTLFSVFQIFLGFWLLSEIRPIYSSLISAILLFSIIIFNIEILDLLFRDIAIMLTAIALSIHYHLNKKCPA